MRNSIMKKSLTAGMLAAAMMISTGAYAAEEAPESIAFDETVCASMDVAVVDFYGTYGGTKHVDAMGCDITVEITLNDDGTFDFYRAPMLIEMEGGGEMPELLDEGTYEVAGAEITFASEALGEYTVVFSMDEENMYLEGKVPTGGPSTSMELVKSVEEAGTETEMESETEVSTEA